MYFEEKLKYLLDNKFLKESSNGKYLTDFCIYPEQIWHDFWVEISELYNGIGKEITDEILKCENEIRSINFYGNHFSFSSLLWILYHFAADMLSKSMLEIYNYKWENIIPKNNGKSYRIAGKVLYPNEKLIIRTSLQRSVPWSNIHYHYKTSGYSHVDYANLFQAEPFGNRDKIINESNADLYMRIYDNPSIQLTNNEEESVANLIRLGYLKKDKERIYPTMPIMTYENQAKIQEILKKAVSSYSFKYAESVAEIGERILLPYTRKDLTEEFAHWIMLQAFFPIGYLYYYGLNESDGILEKPKNLEASSLGICVIYRL